MTVSPHILAWVRLRCALALSLAALLGASSSHAEANRRPPPRAPGNLGQPQAGRPVAPNARAPGGSEGGVNAGALLSRTYEEKAREILERYLPQKEFQVIANVTHNGRPIPRAPYEPKTLTPGSSLNLTPDELAPYVSRIVIEIALANRLNSAKRRIEELLNRGLKLQKPRGDTVTYSPLGIELETDDWKKEKLDLKREMEVIKSENTRLNQEMGQKGRGDKGGGAPAGDSDPGKLSNQPWFLPALVGGACFILLIGLLGIGRGFFSAGKNLGEAVTNVAGALERLGGSLAAGLTGGSAAAQEMKLMGGEGFGGSNGKGLANLPMEAIHAHLLKLRNELLDNMTEGAQSVILKHISKLLSFPETTPKAIVTLELLGRETATEMFKRLSIRSQEAIMVFLRGGMGAGNKIEMMLDAAEDLKTKLLMEGFESVRGKPSERISQKLIQISDDELVQVALEMDGESLPRLFLYLDPQKISAIFNAMKRLNPDRFQGALTSLPKLPEASATEAFDDNIVVALDSIIAKMKGDMQRPFLKVYQDIVELTDSEVSEQLVRELSTDPRIEEFLRMNVITFNTFYVLTTELRNALIDGLSNKDIAALSFGAREEDRDLVLAGVADRRKEMVKEEFESMEARGAQAAAPAVKKARELVLTKIKAMKVDGTLVTAKSDDARSQKKSGENAETGSEESPVSQEGETGAEDENLAVSDESEDKQDAA